MKATSKISGVRDGGVGQHALDVPLGQRAEVADRHRQDGHDPDQDDPDVRLAAKARVGDAQQHGKGCGLGRGRHKANDRCGRAFVDIGRPDMKGRSGDFESEADQHHAECDGQQQRRGSSLRHQRRWR